MTDRDDDAFWRRPAGEQSALGFGGEPAAGTGSPAPTYTGPPPRQAAPRHPVVVPAFVTPPPPRRLPEQDHETLDATEARARTFTLGVGMISGALIVLLLITVVVSCSARG